MSGGGANSRLPEGANVSVPAAAQPMRESTRKRRRGAKGVMPEGAHELMPAAAPNPIEDSDTGGGGAMADLPEGARTCVPAAAGTELETVIDAIVAIYAVYRTIVVAEGDMTRRLKSAARWVARARLLAAGHAEAGAARFPPLEPGDLAWAEQRYPAVAAAEAALHRQRLDEERQLKKLVVRLPIAPWWLAQPGLAEISLAMLVGEAGDLGRYPDRHALFRRMGLNVDATGQAVRRQKGVKNGYVPRRRAAIYVIGANLLRAGNPEYRQIYDDRYALEEARAPQMEKGQRRRRAKRYMEKILLRRVFAQWKYGRALPLSPPLPQTMPEAA